MKITKREIIVSIAIILFTLGIAIGLTFYVLDVSRTHDSVYQHAEQWTDPVDVSWAKRTGRGLCFIEVDLSSDEIVLCPQYISGEYYYIKVVEEYYHESSYWVEDDEGHSIEEWSGSWSYSWDGADKVYSIETIYLNDIKLKIDDVNISTQLLQLTADNCNADKFDSHYTYKGSRYWHTKWDQSTHRYSYYVIPAGGTYSSLVNFTNGDIKCYESSKIDLHNCSLEKLYKSYLGKQKLWLILVWLGWAAITAGLVVGFYYLDNHWLNND